MINFRRKTFLLIICVTLVLSILRYTTEDEDNLENDESDKSWGIFFGQQLPDIDEIIMERVPDIEGTKDFDGLF